jgi:hypothetical protein
VVQNNHWPMLQTCNNVHEKGNFEMMTYMPIHPGQKLMSSNKKAGNSFNPQKTITKLQKLPIMQKRRLFITILSTSF